MREALPARRLALACCLLPVPALCSRRPPDSSIGARQPRPRPRQRVSTSRLICRAPGCASPGSSASPLMPLYFLYTTQGHFIACLTSKAVAQAKRTAQTAAMASRQVCQARHTCLLYFSRFLSTSTSLSTNFYGSSAPCLISSHCGPMCWSTFVRLDRAQREGQRPCEGGSRLGQPRCLFAKLSCLSRALSQDPLASASGESLASLFPVALSIAVSTEPGKYHSLLFQQVLVKFSKISLACSLSGCMPE